MKAIYSIFKKINNFPYIKKKNIYDIKFLNKNN